ncbi:MAG: cupredoxin domain-containing protein [Gammaproteobacteria bacterium]
MFMIINLIGLILIAFIIWWFWLGETKAQIAKDLIEIKVDGGIYHPAHIEVQQNANLTLRFIRHDSSHCAQTVVFPQLGISAELPIKKPYDINLKITKPGDYDFTCAMGMYRGKLTVK